MMMSMVANNVIASQPPKCRPTGTPHARANFSIFKYVGTVYFVVYLSKIVQRFISSEAELL